jgi:UDP-N-acetylmuramoyl-L-alanyl-D-glutamate--2,6-diaminopimelate ligase
MRTILKNLGRALIPANIFKKAQPFYHGILAILAHYYYGRPSQKLIVIGVTGTNGKTTTVNLIASILNYAGLKTGLLSTVNYDLGDKVKLNPYKMTMMSGWVTHRRLRQMLKHKVKYAVVEVSSEGLAQNRHLGINFDIALLTNLTPEHLDAHGSFENYKQAKAKLFTSLKAQDLTKEKRATNPNLKKTIIVNADDKNSKFYEDFPAQEHLNYGVNTGKIRASDIAFSPQGIKFTVADTTFMLNLKGQFDVYNALAALAAAITQGVDLTTAKVALEKITVVPGRVEVIKESPFTVVVDYAYEPEEMRQLYETINRWPHERIIQIIGPSGGGRDKARIKTLGEMAGKFSDITIITTDDPYDDDPQTIGREMANASLSQGKQENRDLFFELDRRKAISLGLTMAHSGDLVLITGKGADQKMALANGQYLPWDDRTVAIEELAKLYLTL